MKASVENILSDISVSSALDQPLYADDIKVSSFDVYDGSLIVNLNKNICQQPHGEAGCVQCPGAISGCTARH
ncbi:MAG: hypothetical protein ACLTJG_07515 [[Clostridium] innocuum]